MKQIQRTRIFLLLLLIVQTGRTEAKKEFRMQSGDPVTVARDRSEEKVVHTALQLLERDCQSVFSASLVVDAKKGNIIVGTLGTSSLLAGVGVDLSVLKGKREGFLLTVLPDGRLLIAGSDKRGTAYGVIELTRLIGVSPWEWWADAIPEKKDSFSLPATYRNLQEPSVAYRGIFINDEDWGISPWSYLTYEPSNIKGQMGPKTHERIFELLLRLRANYFWPAMHECSYPFFYSEGNAEAADAYGIFLGTSHCEPMMRNTNGEWKNDGVGEYDYVHNKENVLAFWKERVKAVAEKDNVYTLGIRGIHDGKMNGANTVAEQKAALTDILKEQRAMLAKYVNPDISRVPQLFIPYKEVLDVYNAGLVVPDDVTLMWCDDNYGYIRHFPTEKERARKGGNALYYHVSYWGRPHDYLWLGTASPALVFQQLNLAYEKGIQKMWILNVGDIKPSEYQIELFLDMAWDMKRVRKEGVNAHLSSFFEREFGKEITQELLPVMREHYRLAFIRKPEFLGNTRTEEKDPKYSVVKDLPWSNVYIHDRLDSYKRMSEKVEQLSALIPDEKQSAWFQLVKYPVQAAAQMNRKLLTAQLARKGNASWSESGAAQMNVEQQAAQSARIAEALWAESDAAYDSIAAMTRLYNKGKWNRMIDFQPRRLPVFERLHHLTSDNMPEETPAFHTFKGTDCTEGMSVICEGLGYEGCAVSVKKGDALTFSFEMPDSESGSVSDSIKVEVCLLPNHPVEGTKLRFSLSVDGSVPMIVSYETYDRSEEWKENVLRNQAIRTLVIPIAKKDVHKLVFAALDEGVVLDGIVLYILKRK